MKVIMTGEVYKGKKRKIKCVNKMGGKENNQEWKNILRSGKMRFNMNGKHGGTFFFLDNNEKGNRGAYCRLPRVLRSYLLPLGHGPWCTTCGCWGWKWRHEQSPVPLLTCLSQSYTAQETPNSQPIQIPTKNCCLKNWNRNPKNKRKVAIRLRSNPENCGPTRRYNSCCGKNL